MEHVPLPHGPALMAGLESALLKPLDVLGRQKCFACGLNKDSPPPEVKEAARTAFVRIERNRFKFKSLSCWSYNIGVGCVHGCLFCYVPSSQQTGAGKEKENTGHLATALREFGVLDPDAEWGTYLLLRPWDEKTFVASLKAAENTPLDELNPDGNRAIIFCSSTDPYQSVSVPGDPERQKLLNDLRRHLVRRALELILEHSTLNVRILTRSPLGKEDFELFKRFGNRLLFGMSLPTLRNDLARIYEPKAPAPSQRLATLQAAIEAGIPVYVAMAPTYPECDEADLRATLEAIRTLNPVTVFHEPINIRAKNVARIEAHAAELGVELQTAVFDNPTAWRRYAINQLAIVQRIAGELGMLGQLHLWPDKSFKSKNAFLKDRHFKFRKNHPGHRETPQEKQQRREADEAAYATFDHWVSHWHNLTSKWPGSENSAAMAPESAPGTMPADPPSKFASLEVVDGDNLSAEDREFLGHQENIIERGQKTFLEVGTALMHIRDHKDGILYRPYGTFEDYCRKRWEFGRAHAHRQIVAATIYSEMSPRGDISPETVLPTNERQLRELGRLPTTELRKAAWNAAVAAAGEKPIRTRDVAGAIRALIKSEGLESPASAAPPARHEIFKISANCVAKMRTILKRLRAAIAKVNDMPKIKPLIDEIEGLLPHSKGD